VSRVSSIRARQILDSRGNPTVEADVCLDSGELGRASVPSGASTGTREAVELRDGGKLFGGRGVLGAVERVNEEISRTLMGHQSADQASLDRKLIDLDGTRGKSRLGANAVLAVSLAYARASAEHLGLPLWEYLRTDEVLPSLPMPMLNVINGGAHADNGIDFQEYMIVPVGAQSFSEALRMSVETYHALGDALRARGLASGVGDEGGFAPNLESNRAALDLLIDGITQAGYRPGHDIAIALDPAANGFYADGVYRLSDAEHAFSAEEMVAYWCDLVDRYPIMSLEDAMAEDDWEGWAALTARLGDQIQLVGDDIFVTDTELLQRGIDAGVANAILIKLNQIGTLTETLETIELANDAGYRSVISHRSGETEDTFIADLAVASGVGQIKTGAPSRGERVIKYNRLLRIEEEMGMLRDFAGESHRFAR
jgi:enolase